MKFSALSLLSLIVVSGISGPISLASDSSFNFTPPAGWVEANHLDTIKSWKEISDQSGVLTLIEDPSVKISEKINDLDADDKTLIEKTKSGASVTNWIAGIHDYKIDKIEREKLSSGGQKIVLVGTYVDFDNRTIQYEEWKYFLPQGYSQIEFSEFAGQKARDRSEVKKILERYKPFGT